MFPEICSEKARYFFKHHFITLMFLAVLLLPYFKYMDYDQSLTELNSFC